MKTPAHSALPSPADMTASAQAMGAQLGEVWKAMS